MVSSWQPNLVISLLELHELEFLGVERLPEEFKKRFEWLHYPVRDLSAPFDSRQQDSPLAEWFSAMIRGERILLHCAAGLGRTGTVAACLLMLAGQSADSAIKQVRAARPGTVESASQEQFLRKLSRRVCA